MVSSSWIRLLVCFLQVILAEDLVALNIFMLTALSKIYFFILQLGNQHTKAVFGRPSGGT